MKTGVVIAALGLTFVFQNCGKVSLDGSTKSSAMPVGFRALHADEHGTDPGAAPGHDSDHDSGHDPGPVAPGGSQDSSFPVGKYHMKYALADVVVVFKYPTYRPLAMPSDGGQPRGAAAPNTGGDQHIENDSEDQGKLLTVQIVADCQSGKASATYNQQVPVQGLLHIGDIPIPRKGTCDKTKGVATILQRTTGYIFENGVLKLNIPERDEDGNERARWLKLKKI